MAISYTDWQKVRKAAQERELAERAADTQYARPPLQIGINDQIVRDLIDRVQRLEAEKASTPAPFAIRAK